MATTTSDRRATAPRVALRQSIARYASGDFTRRDIEKVFASALDQDPACGEVIREYLDQQLHERALSPAVHKDLLEQLVSHLPEDVPTEAAEHVREAVSSSKEPQASQAVKATVSKPGQAAKQSKASISAKAAKSSAAQPAKKSSAVQASEPSPAQDSKSPAAPASASRQPSPGTVLRERFRLDEAVASGSMGLVFRATDLLKLEAGAISPVIAIKVINPEFANDAVALRSFQNEVANTQYLSHPNIIRLFELDKDQGHYFITMEWLEGESLDALLDRSRGSALPPVQAYAIIEQLCDALIYAHGRQVIHADVKPGNVFLTKPGELKLIDFGIARIHNPQDHAADDEQQSVALTPAYASCECLEHQTATAQDDLFSLACLIYRLLSGRRVFSTRTALQAEAEGLEPVAIGGMSAQRWQALRKALAYRRAGRHPDVRSFADEFGQRSEPRNKLVPEPDDTLFTETSSLGFIVDEEVASLHDTGSLRVLQFPIDLQDDAPPVPVTRADNGGARLDMELELPEALDSSGIGALPEPINFFDDADCDESVFVPVEQSTGRFTLETTATTGNAAPTESRLPTESTVPTETWLATESTVPEERSRSGTIEIEILAEPVASAFAEPSLSRVAGATAAGFKATAAAIAGAARVPAANSLLDSGNIERQPAVKSLLDSGNLQPAAAPAPIHSPAVKRPPPKEVATARNAVLEALVAPPVTVAPPPSPWWLQLFELALAKPRHAAAAASALLALLVLLLNGLSGGPDSGPAENVPLSANGIVVPAKALPGDVDAQASSPEAGRTQHQVKLGNPGDVGSAVDAATIAAIAAEANAPQLPAITADTGIAFEGSAVPVPLPGGPRARAVPQRQQPGKAPAVSLAAPADPTAAVTAVTSDPLTPVAEIVSPQAASSDRDSGSDSISTTATQSAKDADPTANNVGDYNPHGPVPFSALQFAYYAEPEFPTAYADQTVEGWVDVQFSITPAGSVSAVELTDTDLPPDFLAPSRAAVSQWRFKPFVWNGMAIAAATTVRLTYSN